MSLSPGTRVGAFDVVGPLGAGGMGEVYRAKDTKLGREVALKTLPEALAHDGERLARVVREAKTLAALNHPHIAQIYGLDDSSGTPVLVMELVEGPTLADRLADGPLTLDEALPIAQQIAEALEAAHDQGIVHRDLKPANIKVRPDGTVKVLDFGLAKAVDGHASTATADESPTITSPAMTLQGVILGTAAYMSPEQAKGKPVDRRADIWAFGCVLYEMLTGRRAFQGEDVSDTLAAVLRGDVTWTALPAATPAPVRALLARCLERDVKKRLPHIGVARLDLGDGTAGESAIAEHGRARSRPAWRVHAAWAAALVIVAATAVWLWPTSGPVAPQAVVRFDIAPPDKHALPGANGVPRFSVSKDGSMVVYAASEIGVRDQLFIRRLSEAESRPIKGTEGPSAGGDAVQQPFFSPDGRQVVFFSGAESLLKRVSVDGGVPERLATVPTQNAGGDWRGDVILVASQGTDGVLRVPVAGGEPTRVTSLDQAKGEIAHLWPQLLPDARRFIYLSRRASESAVYLGSLDGHPPVRLVTSSAMARVAPPDWLLFVRDGTLVAQRIDLGTNTMIGEAIVVAGSVSVATNTRTGIATSDTGTLVTSRPLGTGGNFQIVLKDRKGQQFGSAAIESEVSEPWVRVSPDGRHVAFVRLDGGVTSVWVHDLNRRVSSRVSAGRGADTRQPVWSPDGKRLAYGSNAGGRPGLYTRDIEGLMAETPVFPNVAGHQIIAEDWSPDGSTLLFRELMDASVDLMMLPLAPGGPPTPYRRDGSRNRQVAFSPDGRWVAYGSTEASTTQQVFIRSYPDPNRARIQVSADGGSQPVWRSDGRELFYIDNRGRLIAVPVTLRGDTTPAFGAAVPLFAVASSDALTGLASTGATVDVLPGGERFVVAEPLGSVQSARLSVTLNWIDSLGK